MDTTQKSWFARSPLERPLCDSLSTILLSDSLVFKDSWDNRSIFPYPRITRDDLPDTVCLPVVRRGEDFVLTWYGGINSRYGYRYGRMHRGLDLHLRTGDTVVSAFNGIVRYTGYDAGGYGNCVVVRHLNGLETLYGHLNAIIVQPNQYLRAGECLGLGGSTGRSSGPHLHFETRYKDLSFDPLMLIDPATMGLRSDTLLLARSVLLKEGKKPEAKRTEEPPKAEPVSKVREGRSGTDPSKTPKTPGKSVKSGQPVKAGKPKSSSKNTAEKKPVGKTTADKGKGKATVVKQAPSIYVVTKGDTISGIAKRFGVSAERIEKLNGLKPGATIRIGQKLKLR